ncbi:HAD family hydrolase [Sulfurospirillum sp. 1307]|jgi:phosphoglycolate phosphatase
MIKSIIFDMDGTLLDSSYALTCSVNYVRESIGLEPVTTEYLEYYINKPDQNLAKIFYETKEWQKEHRELFSKHYMENANLHVKPYDGAYELLEELKGKNYSLSIATNAFDIFAVNMLKHQNMLDFFDYIVGANMVEKPKPNPDMIYKISNLNSIPLENTVLVGDSLKDESAAKNAGVDFLFVEWGYGKSQNPTKTFETILELKEFF